VFCTTISPDRDPPATMRERMKRASQEANHHSKTPKERPYE
jgi:hypothetical protein